jgi:Transcriptional regulator, AbiEi antitoxin
MYHYLGIYLYLPRFCFIGDMAQTKTEKLVELVQQQHIIRPKDLERARIPRNYLSRLAKRGQLHKLERFATRLEWMSHSRLRECYRQKKASMNALFEAAKVCRVANVMRPYLESLR